MGAVKKKVEKVMGKGKSTDSPAPAASTTPSPDGNVQASAYSTKRGKKSLIRGLAPRGMTGGSGYNTSGGDFAVFLEQLMKRKTLG
tara:strand:+ start:3217 stop:3474 length:258 start_codon:yes stop_codon:yes gene_type:complete